MSSSHVATRQYCAFLESVSLKSSVLFQRCVLSHRDFGDSKESETGVALRSSVRVVVIMLLSLFRERSPSGSQWKSPECVLV